MFVDKNRALRILVCKISELPARDVDSRFLVPWQQRALRFLNSQILLNRVRLPQDVIVMLQSQHAHVGVQDRIRCRLLVVIAEIKKLHLIIKCKVICYNEQLESPGLGGKT